MSKPSSESRPTSYDDLDDASRRSFLTKVLAVLIGGFVALVPMAAGLATLLDPLRRKSTLGDFLRITSLDSLPEGSPRAFPVIQDRVDAWNYFPKEPIGSVYLRRTGDQVEALNASCPHAGCFVDFRNDPGDFKCPCHDSKFDPTGKRIDPNHCPSPRDMDTLEVDPEKLKQGEVWVRFQNFQAGKAAKIPDA